MTTGQRIDAWLKSNQSGPMSAGSPQLVLKEAHARFQETCTEQCDYGEFVDHLWGRGLVPEQAGSIFYLKIPGRAREYTERHDTPTRILGA